MDQRVMELMYILFQSALEFKDECYPLLFNATLDSKGTYSWSFERHNFATKNSYKLKLGITVSNN